MQVPLSTSGAIFALLGVTSAYILGDRLLDKAYYVPGDLNIGGIFPVTTYNGSIICGVSLFRHALASMEIIEVLAFAVNRINENPNLLPGVKLGFVFLDSCTNPQAGVLQAIRFLPQSSEREYIPTTISNYLHSYKVVGVIGTAISHITTPVSILLGGAGIPLISFWDGSDDLSNKIITFSTLGVLFPVRAVNLQPIISEKLVELVCDIPVPHTIAFLLFSMVLLLLCSIFSLKSQNDPYGFERNRFVSMFVVISLIMWIAFMPAYFTAIHHRMRTYFRILAILVNHTSALILNFTPAFLEVCLRRRKDSGPGGFGYFRSSRQSVTAPAMMAVVPARSRDKADKGKPGPGEMAESQREGHKITFNLHSKLRSSNSHLSSRDNPWNVDPR